MKRWIRPESEDVLLREYPIRAKSAGWFFRCNEVSMGLYMVEGSDVWRRTVCRTGADPDALIAACEEDVKDIPLPRGSIG